MKKLLIVLFAVLMLCGCGTKKTTNDETNTSTENTTPKTENAVLVCSKSTTSTVTFVTEMSYYYENGKTTKLGVKYVYGLSGYNDAQRKAFAGANLCNEDAMTNTLGMVDCQESLVGTDYVVSGFSEKLLSQATASLSLTKSSLEAFGWTCTVQ